ncbi:serine hydrolase domain-containing protein [Sediminibacterium sp.]|uniref:serine hydrolase domain-containing protein n=1 Tax=Sediminibacterium sp. TaxID=1917865 RepID=UPI003F71ADD0
MNKKSWILTCAILFVYTISMAQVNIAHSIQAKLDSLFKQNTVPGILVGSSVKGKHQFYTVGLADKKLNLVFTPETQFEIGSISKTFTAFLLESVMQENGIADTSLITKYLPDSLAKNKEIASIQLLHLLNHTSGLPRLPENIGIPQDRLQPYANYDKEQLYYYLSKVEPKTFGRVTYSNLGAGLAGVVAENISSKSYEQLLSKYINKPFQLKHTGIQSAKKMPKATGYFGNEVASYWNMNVLVGAGGIKSDATDLLTYLDFMAFNQSLPIVKSVLQKTTEVNKQVAIAKAWHTIEKNGTTLLYWHNGGTYGFSTFAAFNPTTQNSIIVVINAFNKNDMADRLGIEIMTNLLNE